MPWPHVRPLGYTALLTHVYNLCVDRFILPTPSHAQDFVQVLSMFAGFGFRWYGCLRVHVRTDAHAWRDRRCTEVSCLCLGGYLRALAAL